MLRILCIGHIIILILSLNRTLFFKYISNHFVNVLIFFISPVIIIIVIQTYHAYLKQRHLLQDLKMDTYVKSSHQKRNS